LTPEIIAILGVGIALAGLIVSISIRNEKRFEQIERRLDQIEQRSAEREQRSSEQFERLEHRFSALEQRMARLDGMLDGLREAMFGRASS
jgi:flagellar capping protein FliD